ncbi:glycosyltransferase family 4 protein [Chloroflexota bacterium]
MKILVVTANYPPYHSGGYGIRLKNIMDELSTRGHLILCITTKPGGRTRQTPKLPSYPILRSLHPKLSAHQWLSRMTLRNWTYPIGIFLIFIRELYLDLVDLNLVEKQIKEFQPDIIYLGHTVILSKSLLPFLADQSVPLVYDEGGSGIIDAWDEKGVWYKFIDGFRSRIEFINSIKSLLIKFIVVLSRNRLKQEWKWPTNMQVFFNSHLNQKNALEKKLSIGKSEVIHSGLDLRKFNFVPREIPTSKITIITPGRFEPRKGQLDAIRLLASLTEKGLDASLILVGEKKDERYYDQVLMEIRTRDLSEFVTILPMVNRIELIHLYQRSDICFFSSSFRTGFSRIPQEAMACGSVVITYGNEGSDEIIRDGYNGFIVKSGDYSGIVNRFIGLMEDPKLFKSITEQARKDIEEKYSMQKYVDCIEKKIL